MLAAHVRLLLGQHAEDGGGGGGGGDDGLAPVLHLCDGIMNVVLLLLQLGHGRLNDAFLVLEGLLQKLVPDK